MFALLAAALVAAASPQLDAVPQTHLDAALRCRLGAYALPAGKVVTITGDGGHARNLRYTLSTGAFGRLREGPDGTYSAGTLTVAFEPCETGRLKLAGEQGSRQPLTETDTTFSSDGIRLHGKLVMPAGAKALAVWIDGSNNDPSTDDTVWQYELARRGVSVFVYDKRGTGTSSGALSADFQVRARDTAAAVQEARRLAPGIRKVGVIGGSQGGWVAPLTATLTPLDFVIPAFAMAEGPIAQDRQVVEAQLAGFPAEDMAKAATLTALTARIVLSNFREGFTELDAFRTEHVGEPWMKTIQPRSYTGILLTMSSADAKAGGAAASQGLSFGYEPRPVIETIKPRQLWLLGGSDRQAPNAGTQSILREIQQHRRDVSVVVFPKADHGLIERTKTAEGTTTSAYSAGLFDITADWIKTSRLPGTGNFVVRPD
ncbi:alpha/beta fold hydrolase [Caulobacter sp.]|uniref:alpha/beta hydrolase family protein n=1 Tax=Caulobacter sp. TaxID=78 RepID=UPI001B02734A|nr:alpha/beta fold hydrolase [Caulobacter sp.]MBO9545932.1 alpha/beta fold hydrolase [Caulobacter sp.]